LVPARQFDELKCPLTVTTVDASNGELVALGAGGRSHVPLVDALYASCALPVYYPPGQIGDRVCLDGGIRAVLPLELAAGFDPEVLFAVDAGPSLHADAAENQAAGPALVRMHDRAVRILMASQAEEAIARCRSGPVPLLLVRPIRRQGATFAIEDVVGYVEEGYRAATRTLDRWVMARE
jgi:NTE family protein